MADEIRITAQDESRAKELEQALSSATTTKALSLDVCGVWGTVKPFWPWIIDQVRKIPNIGGVLATALELIGRAVDAYCTNK